MKNTCPRCASKIHPRKVIGNVIICGCGWYGSKRRRFQVLKNLMYFGFYSIVMVVLIVTGYIIIDGKTDKLPKILMKTETEKTKSDLTREVRPALGVYNAERNSG